MGCCQSNSSEGAFRRGNKNVSDLMEDLMPKVGSDARVCLVKLVELSHIPAFSSFNATSDAFVQFQLSPNDVLAGGQKQISSIKPGTLKPRWEPPERFQFITTQPKDARIVISVYHYVFGKPHESIPLADGVLKLKELIGVGVQEKIIKLTSPTNGANAGEAKLLVQLTTVEEASSAQEHVLYEFQRWIPSLLGTSSWGDDDPAKNLLSSDPGRWCRGDGTHFGKTMDAVAPPVPDGWDVTSAWHTVATSQDQEGWQYSTDFKSPYWYPAHSAAYVVRRRSWHREIKMNVDRKALERAPSITGGPAAAGKGRRQRMVFGRKSS